MSDTNTASGAFDELCAYVGFDEAAMARVGGLAPALRAAIDDIVNEFYRALRQDEGAVSVFVDDAQIERQKVHLRGWLVSALEGPYDDAFLAQRARVGDVHVRIGLPQRYMVMSMNVVRRELHRAARVVHARPEDHDALDALCDLELTLMLDAYREADERKVRRHERLAAVGQLAATIGHELRNPLAVLQTSAQILRLRAPSDARAMKHVDRIETQVQLAVSIVENLLAITRDQPIARQPVALRERIDALLGQLSPPQAARVEVRPLPGLPANVDPTQLGQLLFNLVQNGLQASARTSGKVRVALTRRGDALVVEVEDEGEGFTEEARARLFEPLFTTKLKGVGLGLALCRLICEKHGGEIVASDAPSGGARVVATLPHAFEEPGA